MKRTSRIDSGCQKRNTVKFRSSKISFINSQILQEEEKFTGRTKRNKYPSQVRFKKLQICSEQSKSHQQSSQNQDNNQIDGLETGKTLFGRRTSKKTFTEYRTQRQSIYSRTSEKKKTMIPIKIRSQKQTPQNSLLLRRGFKSCYKVEQSSQVDNMSLKSIHSKYTRLKRQASSLWNIPTNKFINPQLNQSPSKLLEKQSNQILLLQKQFRKILKIFEQEQQRKVILSKLIMLLKREIQYSKQNNENMTANLNSSGSYSFLLTSVPLNDLSGFKNSCLGSPLISKRSLDIQMQNKINHLHQEINLLSKQQNLLTSKINKLKQQVLMSRKDRVMFSSLFKKIQKEIRSQQGFYISGLIQNRNKLGLSVDVQIGSNYDQPKALALKQYLEKGPQNISQLQTHPSTDNFSQYHLKKQQSGIQDTAHLIRNYNSFSLDIFYQSEQEKLKFVTQNKQKFLVKPRKQASSHQSQKLLQIDIQVDQISRIFMIEQFLQKIGISLQIKRAPQIQWSKSNQKTNKTVFSSKCFPFQPTKSFSQLRNLCEKSIKYNEKNTEINDLYSDAILSYYMNSSSFIEISEEIFKKFNTISSSNDSYSQQIDQIDQKIFEFQNNIAKEKQKKKTDLIRVQCQFEEKLAYQNKQLMKKEHVKNFQIYSTLIQFCSDFQIPSQSPLSSNRILNFVNSLQGFYEETKLKTKEENCVKNESDKENKRNSELQDRIEDIKSLKNHCLKLKKYTASFEVGIQHKINQQPKQMFRNFSQTSEQPQSLTSSTNPFKSNIQLGKSFKGQQTVDPLTQRPSRGLNTLMMNMSIFQSYQKALSRQDFQNEYKKQIQCGKKKKKTLLKRPVGFAANA